MLLAESYLHTLDPFVFTPGMLVRWYGLAYAVGFLCAWLLIRWIARKSWSPIPPERVGDLMFAVIVGVLLGGRLGYALFYEPRLFTGFSSSLPYWDLLAINKGGMASHGGMIGVLLAVMWFGWRNHLPIAHIVDVGALGNTPGFFFGRLANFINAELWGKPIPPHLQQQPPWWSVKYPEQITERWMGVLERGNMSQDNYRSLVHAAAADFNIHAAESELVTQVAAEATRRLDSIQPKLEPLIQNTRLFDSAVAIAKDADHSLHDQVAAIIMPHLTAYYPSQIFQMFTDGLFVALLLILIWLKPRKPGVIGCWYLIIYGFMRIVAEMFRQPDAGVPLTFGVLSRGQTLSALMMLLGVVLLWMVSRRPTQRLGGLFSN